MSCAGSDERAFEGPASLSATPVFHNPTSTLQAVHFVDAERGWAVGDDGTVLATSDGGRSWAAQTAGTAAILWSVDFVDAQNGGAVGDRGTVLPTTHGGRTRTAQGAHTTATQLSVDFVDR
ncbi:MAG: YCF48-related protein, partial [Gammaproteobacteria bacterium]|nr:YCF48-related protein [Gammaproteobacteria bacterium]